MPKLDLKSAHEYWKDYADPMIYRVLSFMEAVEHWTFDGDTKLEIAMDKFGEALDNVKKYRLGKEDSMLKLGCYIKATRILRILQAIDTIEPGAASRLLMYAEEHTVTSDDPAGLFLRRNIVFERLRLLSRIFAPERFNILLKALEGDTSAN
jgi:intracellular multiplication protein IcmW